MKNKILNIILIANLSLILIIFKLLMNTMNDFFNAMLITCLFGSIFFRAGLIGGLISEKGLFYAVVEKIKGVKR